MARRNREQTVPRPAGSAGGRPVVAIVGRPNVGKSTLFNRLSRGRIAIVEDEPGVTRDRLYADAEAFGRRYVLVDTGGFDPQSEDPMTLSIAGQVQIALDEADLVVCVLDGMQDATPADVEAVRMLRSTARPVLFVANRIDNPNASLLAKDLYRLGIDRLFEISALHGHGIGDLEEAMVEKFPEPREETDLDVGPDAGRIAIVGRPNAGKSSLVNRLLGEERQLVDDRPGTTVDSVDTVLDVDGEKFVLIDTAGIRKPSRVERGVEALGVMRAIRAVERCDVAVLVIDATTGASEQDARIAGMALERGCGLVVALNKMDCLDREATTVARGHLRDTLSFVPWAPVRGMSAKTGRGVRTLWTTVREVSRAHRHRVGTAEANRFFEEVLARHPPPAQSGRSVHLYYVTQASTRPPTFVISANHPDYVHKSYQRYVQNQLRDRFKFVGTPVRVFYRAKNREKR